jgi:hypothetical protein
MIDSIFTDINMPPFILPNKDMIAEARLLSKQLGVIRNSRTQGIGSVAGYMGELADVQYLVGSEHVSHEEGEEKYKRDILYKGYTIESKTKRRMFDPKPNFEASEDGASSHQNSDIILFNSITFGKELKPLSIDGRAIKQYANPLKIWLVGWISREDFYKKAFRVSKGYIDPSNQNYCSADKWNIYHEELNPLTELLNIKNEKS